jgi:hypothetical protein
LKGNLRKTAWFAGQRPGMITHGGNADMHQSAPLALPARNLSRSQWRVVALASLGGSLEFYDFVIYGIFAQYIARQFFPANDRSVSCPSRCWRLDFSPGRSAGSC